MGVFACSDLHGRYDLFKMIQDFLKEDDQLFVIGDVVNSFLFPVIDKWGLLNRF